MKRFWDKVDICGPNECWNWKASKLHAGYGAFKIGGRKGTQHNASRVAYILTFGDLPRTTFVLHHCDNPSCCNPSHLFIGSQRDNMVDCSKKGRIKWKARPGTLHHKAKITNQDVLDIREKYANGGISQIELAAEFGIKQPMVSSIIRRRNWTHI